MDGLPPRVMRLPRNRRIYTSNCTMRVYSLQDLSRAILVQALKLVPRRSSTPNISVLYQYLIPAAALLPDIAHMCEYQKSPILTELFLPILFARGKINMSADNAANIFASWKSKKYEHLIPSVTHLKVGHIDRTHYFEFLPLLGYLTALEFLDVGSLLDDDLLAVLGINCPLLRVFDAREDTANGVSDVGLSYLTQCKKLRCIFFSEFADEYDYSLDKVGFTGKGLGLLLVALPHLEQIQCSEYLLRDALHFLYQAAYHKQTLSVRCMFMDHPEVNAYTLQTIPILCPKIEVFSLFVDYRNAKLIGKSLGYLKNLRMLVMTLSGACKFQQLDVKPYGHHLVYLQITVHTLESSDLLLLSQACSHLKTLVIRIYSFGFDGMSEKNMKLPLFPKVEKLELHQNVSIRLFKLLNSKMTNLRELYCAWATIHDLDEVLKAVVGVGGWKKVEVLVLPITTEINLQMVQLLATSLPNLICLSVTVHPAEYQNLSSLLLKCSPNITVTDQELVTPPSASGVFSQDLWTPEVHR